MPESGESAKLLKLLLDAFPSPLVGGASRSEATGEGFSPPDKSHGEDRDPSSGASRHLLPQGEKGKENYFKPSSLYEAWMNPP